FLREAAQAAGVTVNVHCERIEDFTERPVESVDVVTARALKPLPELLGLAYPLLKSGARGLFLKGQDVAAELTEASKYWSIESTLAPSRTDQRGQIVVVERLHKRYEPLVRKANQEDAENPKTDKADSAPPEDPTQAQVTAFTPKTEGKTEGRSEPARPPRVLSIANQKGGVGKTTTAINLGTALAAIGEKVLIVDLDPQGNASTGLGIDRRDRRCSTYDVLTGEAPMRKAILATAVPRLYIAASTLDLSGLELELGQARDRAFRLRHALAQINSGGVDDYSYVLVDCPPSLNLLTVNAMAAAD